jgi:hypothetical protein
MARSAFVGPAIGDAHGVLGRETAAEVMCAAECVREVVRLPHFFGVVNHVNGQLEVPAFGQARSRDTCGLPMWSCGMDFGNHRLTCIDFREPVQFCV